MWWWWKIGMGGRGEAFRSSVSPSKQIMFDETLYTKKLQISLLVRIWSPITMEELLFHVLVVCVQPSETSDTKIVQNIQETTHRY